MYSRALNPLHNKNTNTITSTGLNLDYLILMIIYYMLVTSALSACSRSPLEGAAQFNCGDGDRVISAAHLFCVYRSPRIAREDQSQGGEMSAGEMSAGGMSADELETIPQCPLETPHLYVYDTLYICSAERAVSDDIIQSAVATWLREYDDVGDDRDEADSWVGILEPGDPDGGTSTSGGAPPSPIGLLDQGIGPDRP